MRRGGEILVDEARLFSSFGNYYGGELGAVVENCYWAFGFVAADVVGNRVGLCGGHESREGTTAIAAFDVRALAIIIKTVISDDILLDEGSKVNSENRVGAVYWESASGPLLFILWLSRGIVTGVVVSLSPVLGTKRSEEGGYVSKGEFVSAVFKSNPYVGVVGAHAGFVLFCFVKAFGAFLKWWCGGIQGCHF